MHSPHFNKRQTQSVRRPGSYSRKRKTGKGSGWGVGAVTRPSLQKVSPRCDGSGAPRTGTSLYHHDCPPGYFIQVPVHYVTSNFLVTQARPRTLNPLRRRRGLRDPTSRAPLLYPSPHPWSFSSSNLLVVSKILHHVSVSLVSTGVDLSLCFPLCPNHSHT